MSWPSKINKDPPRKGWYVRYPPELLEEAQRLATQYQLSLNVMLVALLDAGLTLHSIPRGAQLIAERIAKRRARTEKPKKEAKHHG